MPDPIIAIRRHQPDHPESVTRLRDGLRGRRWFEVNTGDPAQAVFATGLPKLGDPWNALDPNLSGLLAVQIGEPDTWCHIRGESSRQGVTFVPVDYETQSYSSGQQPDPPPDPSLRHTIYSYSTSAVTVRRGLAMTPEEKALALAAPFSGQAGTTLEADEAGAYLIANGDGASKTVGQVVATVHGFRQLARPFDEAAIEELFTDPAVNSDQVVLPSSYGASRPRTFAAGKLLTSGVKVEVIDSPTGRLWHLELTLQVAFSWFEYWANVNKDGQPQGERIFASKKYRSAPLSPIIP